MTRPVAVENAKIGNAILLEIEKIEVDSYATSSGTHRVRPDAFGEDPSVDRKCPKCGTEWPESKVEGVGEDSIRCEECGAPASSVLFDFGYTVAFDEEKEIGISVSEEAAGEIARNALKTIDLPENSQQHPISLFKPAKIPGTLGRLAPFIGNIGTVPSIEVPDSRNAGDLAFRLICASHPWSLPDENALRHLTDAHMDIKDIREGAKLLCPVKVEGGGVYIGDMHANQGSGEIASHALDVSGSVEVRVNVIENLDIEGPLIFPNPEDLPKICRPFTHDEIAKGEKLAERYDVELSGSLSPIQFVGSGETINKGTENAVKRVGDLLGMSEGEVRVRCTYTGRVCIGRLPGIVQLSMLCPLEDLAKLGIEEIPRSQYEIH